MTSGYLRYPHVHGDEIVFVAANDIWLAPLAGGRAQRLTNSSARVGAPFFSPDGTSIAWTSSVDGAPDAYVLDRETGDVARLTWWSTPQTKVAGWIDDDHVLVASGFESGFTTLNLYSVDADCNAVRLPYGPAMGLAQGPNGAVATVTPNGRDSAMWKRYRGGMAGRLWLDPTGNGDWLIVEPDQPAGKYAPGWFGDRLIFSSDLGAGAREITDPSFQAQLYSVAADGTDLQQHTHHTFEQGYVRDPRTDGTTIVYHARGRLYAMDGLDATPREIEIDLGIGAPAGFMVEPTDQLTQFRTDHGGDGSLFEWRGAAFYLTHRAGPARAVSALPGVRVREPRILGKTGLAIMATDAEGEDALEIVSLTTGDDPKRIARGKLGRVLDIEPNPAGDAVAVISHDGTVNLVTLDGKITRLGRSPEGEATGLAWSPDGRYIVWRAAIGAEGEIGRLMCVDVTTKPARGGYKAEQLTSGVFDDRSPAFTRDGKYLVFLSSRTFDPHYDEHSFDLSFLASMRPWLVPLRADEPAPFGASADGWPISDVQDASGAEAAGAPSDDKPEPKKVECQIDVEGFEDRLVAFPVPSGEYRNLQTAKDGVLWIHEAGSKGVLGTARAGVVGEPATDALERFGLTSRRLEVLTPKVTDYAVSGDGERIVVRAKDDVVVLPSDRKVGDDDDPSRISVDLTRLRREITPRDEWRQMFDENGRIMAQHFWREDMDGVDWAGVLAMYRPIVERMHCRDDLVDMLWETVGELNTSHAYVSPPDMAINPALTSGRLGINVSHNAAGEAVIDRIVPGESSDPRAWSPLRAAGVAAKDGDIIEAVDGQGVANVPHIGALLRGSVGKPVELTLRRGKGKPRRVAVVPMANEEALRYHDWVESRRAYVEKATNGRLGYVHVPDMMGIGWAQLHRQIARATQCEGIVLDVRYNRGGHTSQLVIERLSRTVQGWDYSRHFDSPMSYPAHAVRGPVVLIANQWSGSDGDIVNAVAQVRGLGPVVGERTWGGVIGIDSRFSLVDGTGVTQPRYSSWFALQEWGIENHGVDPDVEVILTPADWESDDDIQLDTAIAIALKTLDEKPASVAPEFLPPRF